LVPGNAAVNGAHLGSGLTVGGRGEKAASRWRSEVVARSGRQRGGGQRDRAAIGEREEDEDPVRQWKCD
jgi:hypothetical protein